MLAERSLLIRNGKSEVRYSAVEQYGLRVVVSAVAFSSSTSEQLKRGGGHLVRISWRVLRGTPRLEGGLVAGAACRGGTVDIRRCSLR